MSKVWQRIERFWKVEKISLDERGLAHRGYSFN